MWRVSKARIFVVALLIASSMLPSLAHGQCSPEPNPPDSALFRFHLPATCTEEEKRKYPIQSKEIVEAIKAGKAVDIENAVIQGPFTLRSITVEAEVSIRRTRLTDRVDWSYAAFRKVLTLDGNTFAKGADFTGATIEKDLNLKNTNFETEANFQLAGIKGLAAFIRVMFKQGANFNGAHMDGGAFFQEATFEGKQAANFRRAEIGRRAVFNEAKFKQGASFNDAQIEGSAVFYNAIFEGKQAANFESARIVGQAIFDGAKFEQGASFHSALINESASFRRVIFGAANFGSARIGGAAVFDGAEFKGRVSFNGAQITGRAYFLPKVPRAREGPVRFEQEVNFKGTRIGGGADFSNTVLTKASFKDAEIKGSIIFKDATFYHTLDLQGLVYSRIDVSWYAIKGRLYPKEDTHVYAQLETSFRQSGERVTADDIYFRRRDVEGDNIDFSKERLRWLNDRTAWLLIDYGRQPFKFVWFSVFVVILGMVMFRRAGAVEPKRREKCPLHSNCQSTTAEHCLPWRIAFWVSLNAFLPGVEVTAANAWDPSPLRDPLLKISYIEIATILRMVGWIVLVLGFSALPEFLLR